VATEISLIEPIRAQDVLLVLLHDDLVANGVRDSFDLAHGGTEELLAQGSWWVGEGRVLHGVPILGVRVRLGTRLTCVLGSGGVRVVVLGSGLGIRLRLMQQRIKLSARLGSGIKGALGGGGQPVGAQRRLAGQVGRGCSIAGQGGLAGQAQRSGRPRSGL